MQHISEYSYKIDEEKLAALPLTDLTLIMNYHEEQSIHYAEANDSPRTKRLAELHAVIHDHVLEIFEKRMDELVSIIEPTDSDKQVAA